MKKGILIFSAVWGVCMIETLAQEPILETGTPLDIVEITAGLDTLSNKDSIEVILITDDMPNAIVHQDSSIRELMLNKRIGYVRGEQLKEGFRVQIYASNNQQQAKKEATELQQRIENLIDIPIYTLSEPPFWKVRIGNFENREEANVYKNTLLQLFPELTGSTYVVPDKIIVMQ
ncbi:MAG: SPOR domain-containing protein [Paludibacteraceae bacterium]|nr:SPOR domain-containing protein [Paludibacteraceae bacterium]